MGKKSKGRKSKGKTPKGGAAADAVADAGIDVAATAALLLSTGIGTSGAAAAVTGSSNKPKDEKDEAAPGKFCSACGTKSDTVKKCNGCKCVWYCDKECQSKHREEHKEECKRIKKELDERGGKLDVGTEIDVGPLGKLPAKEECPICMRLLPLHPALETYKTCCGKTLCASCDWQHWTKSGGRPTCAFCRTPATKSDAEVLARLRKRVKCNDPHAKHIMAQNHGYGKLGLPVDQAKCIELLRETAGVSFPAAQYQLGQLYRDGGMGLEQNEEEALKYFKGAAEGGHTFASHNIACTEGRKGNNVAAMRYFRLSASGGFRNSIGGLLGRFENGIFHHSYLAEALQAMYLARAEMKSEERDQYIKYLKRTGKYTEEYGF